MDDMIKVGVSTDGMYGMNKWHNELTAMFGPRSIEAHNLDYKDTPDNLDFIIFDGGSDIYPHFYGEEMNGSYTPHLKRDFLEQFLFHRYFHTKTRYVGICRGLQFLNIMMNGTLHQDLREVNKEHRGSHIVVTEECDIEDYVPRSLDVNSLHHQGIKELGMGLLPTLVEPHTSLIEGIQSDIDVYPYEKIRAVQCHPEMGGFKYAQNLMKYLFWMDQ